MSGRVEHQASTQEKKRSDLQNKIKKVRGKNGKYKSNVLLLNRHNSDIGTDISERTQLSHTVNSM